MTYDIALTEVSGVVTLHYAYCPQVRTLAMLGFPVATLLECERLPDDDLPVHSCLDQQLPPQGPKPSAR